MSNIILYLLLINISSLIVFFYHQYKMSNDIDELQRCLEESVDEIEKCAESCELQTQPRRKI